MPKLYKNIEVTSCNCIPDQSIGGKLGKTEYYTSEKEAISKVIQYITNDITHWCVHINNKHITAVKSDNIIYGGMERVFQK